ncbi:MAG TPA: glucose-6-phosphate dehydrogenase [Pseudonocardia sp.]|jgi:glucose-6-phosphate 1-dehydrogenase|nr:glucose-6-phosphate dehydrogenase [Pseudonocardia sp.]
MSGVLVLLGATGDLAARYLLPALVRLRCEGVLPDGFAVLGVGREDEHDAGFRDRAAAALREHAADLPPEHRDGLVERLHYLLADVTDPDALGRVLAASRELADGPPVIYLALPNTLFGDVLAALGGIGGGLPPDTRLVVEKPFGVDLADARRLNALLADLLPERAVFRVDHFLAMQTVLNLLGLRFANRILEPVWNARHVERVDIVFDETLGLEGRAGYYDTAGALRDMLQNHLLQLLCLVAMEPPTSLGERDLRDRKVDVLRAVRPLDGVAAEYSVRARYTAGRIGGRELPDYVAEDGVDPGRGTETFARLTLHVDNWRWAGVPFVLRSGKALGRDRQEVVVTFRPVPHQPFGGGPVAPDVLRLTLDPDRIAVELNLNGAGDPFRLERAELAADLAATSLPPYAQLLAGVLAGDPRLSLRGDEAEEQWRIVEPVLAAWAAGEVPLREYPAGSAGPG